MKTTFKDTEGNVIRSFDDLTVDFTIDQEVNIPLEASRVKGKVTDIVVEEDNRVITIEIITQSKY